MQDMVPGLAIEEFSTPPSSPVLATRTRRKAAFLTTNNSVDHKHTNNNSKLDLVIDAENQSSKHLGQIADSMCEWQGAIAEELELTPADIAAINMEYPKKLKLQA